MMKRGFIWLLCLMIVCLMTQGCASGADTEPDAPQTDAPLDARKDDGEIAWPRDSLDWNSQGIPELTVYVASTGKNEQMDIETYVSGVLAGEMNNEWPMEALRAQAILARTYAVKFLAEKKSQYTGADISTDIKEAQAYSADKINERVTKAAWDTSGVVLFSQGKLPYAWFHAHSGGTTALAKEGLGYDKAEPAYTRVVKSMETPDAPAEAQAWRATFAFSEIGAACAKQGINVSVGQDSIVSIGQTGASGRAITLLVNDQAVEAAAFRIALGSTKMRSTLLSEISVSAAGVTFAGRGYGHGVGMSQWGAYSMAMEGRSAKEIIEHYFKQVELYRLWGDGEASVRAEKR